MTQSFDDFCAWMGTQKRAAEVLGVSESTVSRYRADPTIIPREIAEKCEEFSRGLFKKERILWPADSAEAA